MFLLLIMIYVFINQIIKTNINEYYLFIIHTYINIYMYIYMFISKIIKLSYAKFLIISFYTKNNNFSKFYINIL